MTDHVEYAMPLGPLGGIAHRLFIAKSLRAIFNYRAAEMALRVAADAPGQ